MKKLIRSEQNLLIIKKIGYLRTPQIYIYRLKKEELNEPLTFFYGKLNSFVAIHCYY